MRLSISPDKKELLLYAQEDGKLTLSVIDAVTGELLQCLVRTAGVAGGTGVAAQSEAVSAQKLQSIPVPDAHRIIIDIAGGLSGHVSFAGGLHPEPQRIHGPASADAGGGGGGIVPYVLPQSGETPGGKRPVPGVVASFFFQYSG